MKYNHQPKSQPRGVGSAQSRAQQKAEARKRLKREIEALARRIHQFRIDSQRFFAGDLRLPPDELRARISDELRRLQRSKHTSSAQSFRLGSLEAQFNSHTELFGRRLREREQGIRSAKARRPEPVHDPRQGVLFGRDGAVEALYKGLYLKGGAKAKNTMDLERFRNYLKKQAEAIRVKTGCAEIQFRVAEEGGKMKIKAKPIRSAGG